MKKFIHCIRHGQFTEEIPYYEDPWLDETGKSQAKCMGDYFSGKEFDEIRISPLVRTRETYELSNIKGKTVSFDSRLIEASPPKMYLPLIPYTVPSVEGVEPDQQDAWQIDASERVHSLLMDLRQTKGQEILLIAHWAILGAFMINAIGYQPIGHRLSSFATMDHCCHSLLILEDDSPAHISFWNSRETVANLKGNLKFTQQTKR